MLAKNTCGEIGAFVHRWQECKTVLLLWKTAWGGSSKIKPGVTICSSNSILGVHPKEVKAWACTDICTLTFRAALFKIARS